MIWVRSKASDILITCMSGGPWAFTSACPMHRAIWSSGSRFISRRKPLNARPITVCAEQFKTTGYYFVSNSKGDSFDKRKTLGTVIASLALWVAAMPLASTPFAVEQAPLMAPRTAPVPVHRKWRSLVRFSRLPRRGATNSIGGWRSGLPHRTASQPSSRILSLLPRDVRFE